MNIALSVGNINWEVFLDGFWMILNFQSIDTKELEFFSDLGFDLLVWIQNKNILKLYALKLF